LLADCLLVSGCLRRWLRQKQECPVCRAELPVVDAPVDSDRDSSDEDDEERARYPIAEAAHEQD
jgi:hypothetical protein